MFAYHFPRKSLIRVVAIIALLVVQITVGQEAPTLLRLQRSRTTAETDATGGMRGQGGNIYSLGASAADMGVSNYPNSASCLVVYNDGKYVLEKRDEQTVGKPKVKSADGTLGGEDLQQLKAILENEGLKKVADLKGLEPPAGAQTLREAEMLEALINHDGTPQHFVAIKERFKTQAIGTSGVSAAASTGMDAYLDNASTYRKSLNPLVKWFEGIEKKSKSSFRESKPQYCGPMTL